MKNLNNKPICVVNIEGYYNGFIEQLNAASSAGLLYSLPEKYFNIFNDPKDALDYCQSQCLNTNYINNKDDDRIKLRKDDDTNTSTSTSTSTTTNNSSRKYSLFEVGTVFIIGTIIGVLITKRNKS
jgi:hypothetical protein